MSYGQRLECLKARGGAVLIGGWITIFVAVTAPGDLMAGVFRCTDEAGGVLFQQTPCAQGEAVELDIRTTEWVASPKVQPLRKKRHTKQSHSREQAVLARAAREERKQERACWKARQRIERIENELRRGYKPSRGERLREQRRYQSDYIRKFCR